MADPRLQPRFHTNDSGKTLPCSAEYNECRFAHGATPEEAARNWQATMESLLIPAVSSSQQLVLHPTPGVFFGEKGASVPLELELDPGTALAIERLISKGFNPLVVGGAVRDGLRGESPKDFDIEVHGAESFEDLTASLKGMGALNATGKSFGVLKLRVRLSNGELSDEIDLALPRRDSKTGEGHRGFEVVVDPQMGILEATARRDLTVNALLWDPARKIAVDFHGGFEDMENKTLRHVSPAFSEDPLRVLRVARFASKLGFTPAAETVEISQSLEDNYNELPRERISGELSRMILEPHPTLGLRFLESSGWGSRMGLIDGNADSLGGSLSRGLKLSSEAGISSKSSRRTIQLSIIAAKSSEAVDQSAVLSNFAATKAETNRALAIASAPSPGGSDKELRQWAWDNQSISAREKIILDHAMESESDHSYRTLSARLEELKIIDNPEKDSFDSQAVISAHRAANPELKNGPWIRELLQKHRTMQYER